MLPDHGYRPIAIGDLKNEEWLFKDRDKKWDPALQEYVFRVELQPTENARPSSSSTEAPKVIEALCECACCKLKSKQKYRCKPCHSKAATLSKMFHHWPLTAFENLSDEQKVAFWRQGSKTRENMLKDLEVSITTEHLNKEISGKNK